MKRSVTSRGWIVAHAIVLVFVVACVLLGRWQLQRLDEKRDRNRLAQQRMREAPIALETAASSEPSSVVYRRVEATGTYDASRQFLLVGRASHGRPGDHVLTPLRTTNEIAIVVDRGWVPLSGDTLNTPGAQPPAGQVRVTGVLVPAERGVGRALSTSGPPSLSHLDVDALATALPYPIVRLALHLQRQAPAQALPEPAALPRFDAGPHKSYAIQWFLFAVAAVIGWAVFVRHAAWGPEPI